MCQEISSFQSPSRTRGITYPNSARRSVTYPNSEDEIVPMKDPWFRISKAAAFLGISVKTLLRAEQRRAIRFSRNRRDWRCIQLSELRSARVLTLGQLAKRLDLSYKFLLKAARRHQLPCSRPYRRYSKRRSYRRASLAAGYRLKRWVDCQRALRERTRR